MKKIILIILAALIIICCTKKEKTPQASDKHKTDTSGSSLYKQEDSIKKSISKELTFSESLTPESIKNNVTFKTYTPETGVEPKNIVYVIDFNGKSITDTARSYTDIETQFIDIDKKDGYKEFLLKINPGSEETGSDLIQEFRVYKFTDKPVLITGKFLYSKYFTPDGKGKVSATSSKLFTSLNETYIYSNDGLKLEEVPVDFYKINESAAAKVPVNLLKERNENSGSATIIEQNEKVILIGFDKKEIKDGNRCYNWFKIKRPNGKSGWLLIECCNFEEFFNDIHCAG